MSAPADSAVLERVRDVVAIHSAKGGVGKSTVSANLAVALARQGLRVGLLDADVHGPSIAHMFGSDEHPPPAGDGARVRPIERHGVRYLSLANVVTPDAPVIWRGPMVVECAAAARDHGRLGRSGRSPARSSSRHRRRDPLARADDRALGRGRGHHAAGDEPLRHAPRHPGIREARRSHSRTHREHVDVRVRRVRNGGGALRRGRRASHGRARRTSLSRARTHRPRDSGSGRCRRTARASRAGERDRARVCGDLASGGGIARARGSRGSGRAHRRLEEDEARREARDAAGRKAPGSGARPAARNSRVASRGRSPRDRLVRRHAHVPRRVRAPHQLPVRDVHRGMDRAAHAVARCR